MWIKLDDGFAAHPKLVAAGPLALAIQVRAICYAGRYLTDGFIPNGVVSSLLTGMEHIGIEVAAVGDGRGGQLAGFGEDADEIDWPSHMVEHGLWEKVEGGYQIHDYLDWNLSKKQVEEWRRKMSAGGKKGMKARWNQSDKTISHDITLPVSQAITHHITSRTGLGQDKDRSLESSFSSLSSPEKEEGNTPKSENVAAAKMAVNLSRPNKQGDLRKVHLADVADKWFPPIP